MKKNLLAFPIYLFLLTFFVVACSSDDDVASEEDLKGDHVYLTKLNDLRLGDGVPIDVSVSIRWRVTKSEEFLKDFPSFGKYDSLVIVPKAMELANHLTAAYASVDSMFEKDRDAYVRDLKTNLKSYLSEGPVEIRDVVVSRIGFPADYIKARELIAMKEQELKRIRSANTIQLEEAEAQKKKAEADGQVRIAQSQAEAEVQKIDAKTEESRRKTMLARAETEKRVDIINAQAEAERKRMMDKADLYKKEDLKNLEVQKQKDLDLAEMERDLKRAELYEKNPTYAKYVINKELASKVKIAVVPTGKDPNVFSNLLNDMNEE